jgi:hypothetical protein
MWWLELPVREESIPDYKILGTSNLPGNLDATDITPAL